jgi:hypothetical protein
MPTDFAPKTNQPLDKNMPEGKPDSADAENQPDLSTHDEQEASTQVQRTATEGPRRMPQP